MDKITILENQEAKNFFVTQKWFATVLININNQDLIINKLAMPLLRIFNVNHWVSLIVIIPLIVLVFISLLLTFLFILCPNVVIFLRVKKYSSAFDLIKKNLTCPVYNPKWLTDTINQHISHR